MIESFDYIIVGAGIVGMCLGQRLREAQPQAKILILEKEPTLGRHASGRNSGVLHAGIYYKPGSLKAMFCRRGATYWRQFCAEQNIPLNSSGKVILSDDPAKLRSLCDNALRLGTKAEVIDQQLLREIEPEARPGPALYSPTTAVVTPTTLLDSYAAQLKAQGVIIRTGETVASMTEHTVHTQKTSYSFAMAFNCAGAYADRLAHSMGLAKDLRLIPVLGRYWQTSLKVKGNIYPLADARFPFLGVHFTKPPSGPALLGPSALPVLGREQYRGPLSCAGMDRDWWRQLTLLAHCYLKNSWSVRSLMQREAQHLSRKSVWRQAQQLAPQLTLDMVQPSPRVGIRPQLFDSQSGSLVMDFHIEATAQTVHIVNMNSPGFTAAPAFAQWVVDKYAKI